MEGQVVKRRLQSRVVRGDDGHGGGTGSEDGMEDGGSGGGTGSEDGMEDGGSGGRTGSQDGMEDGGSEGKTGSEDRGWQAQGRDRK